MASRVGGRLAKVWVASSAVNAVGGAWRKPTQARSSVAPNPKVTSAVTIQSVEARKVPAGTCSLIPQPRTDATSKVPKPRPSATGLSLTARPMYCVVLSDMAAVEDGVEMPGWCMPARV